MTQSYLRARYYDPGTGRFVSEDPIQDGTNWYAYCGNNPVMFVDPMGTDGTTLEYIDNIIHLKENYNATGVHNQSDNDYANEMRNYLMYESPLTQYALYNEYITQIMETGWGGTLEQFQQLRDIATYTAVVYYDNNPDQATQDLKTQNAVYVEKVAGINRPYLATGVKNIFGQKTDPNGRRYWDATLGYTVIGNSLEIQRRYADTEENGKQSVAAIIINDSFGNNGTTCGKIVIRDNWVQIVTNSEPDLSEDLPKGP